MSHLLRPEFTHYIYKNIVQESKSLNIFGEKGVGKSRFIEDLLTLIYGEIKVIRIDIRTVRNSYDKLVDEIKKQLGTNGETLSEVLESFATSHNQTLFIIDNFEELYKDNADSRYNFDFFGELNAYKNKPNASLIVLSSKNYTHHNFYHNDKLSTSPLDLQVMEITPLTLENIGAELRDKSTVELEYAKLANMVIGSKEIYSFMEFIIRELKFGKYDDNATLIMNFEKFKKQFHKENNIPLYVQAVVHVKRNPNKVINFLKELFELAKNRWGNS